MKQQSLTVAAVVVLILSAASSAPAGAGGYEPGSGFKVGGVYFHVVSVSSGAGALFRVNVPLPGHRAERNAGCYREGRAFYHPEACEVVKAHFARHGARAGRSSAPSQASYGTGSHPIDYLRGTYVEPERSSYRTYAGLFYGPWLVSAHRGGVRARPGFAFRGRGRFGGFARGSLGSRSLDLSLGRW